MNSDLKATLIEQGGKIASDLFRTVFFKPTIPKSEPNKPVESTKSVVVEEKPAVKQAETDKIEKVTMQQGVAGQKSAGTPTDDEIAYRWECCCKHLGAASGLLKEAYERAIGDDGIGPGTAEKVMAALNEHSTMEDDLGPMLTFKETHDDAVKLLDATRKFRRAAWDCHITTGGGTIDDIEAAKMWNDMLFQTVYANAKLHPGLECVQSGM